MYLHRNHHESSEVFIYCGHGSGDKFIDVFKLRQKSCPTSLLWGCSSAKLIRRGIYDPSGPALNYLLAGAKAVVGNLWDVTDKDLDKFSVQCMTVCMDPEAKDHPDLAVSVQQARDVCKLKHIVGCAPVIYGYPTTLQASSR
jgi:separase